MVSRSNRFLSLLIALLLLVQLLPLPALAGENDTLTPLAPITIPYTYPDAVTPPRREPELQIAAAEEPVEYLTSIQTVGQLLRENMLNWESTVVIGYQTSGDAVSAFYDAVDIALSHTGSPRAGDYLRHQCGIGGSISDRTQNGIHYLTLTFEIDYFTTAQQESQMDEAVASLVPSLRRGTDYETVRAVYDWITANVSYDYANLDDTSYLLKHSAYAALIDRTAVCQGYALLLYRLLLECGIDCRIITGDAGGRHAWNIVELENLYYFADSTWDTVFRNKYRYFLLGTNSVTEHAPDAEYLTPAFLSAYPQAENDYLKLAIVEQPRSVSVNKGETATVSLKAVGDRLTYQWYYADRGSSLFTEDTTVSGSAYSIVMTDSVKGRRVYCIVSDASGNRLRSDTVTLNMNAPLTITRQPVSVTVAEGETAKVTVTAQGEGLTYAWYFAEAGSDKFYKTNSFNGNTYAVTMTPARSGRRIYCVITDAEGNQVRSDTVRLNMKADLAITAQPVSVTVEEGETAKVTVSAQGNGLTYEWFFANAGSDKFYKTSSFKGNTYAVTMTPERSGRRIYCVITDADGNQVRSDTVSLNMKVNLAITAQPVSVTVEEGKTARVTVSAVGSGLAYEWFFANSGSSRFYKTETFKGNTYSVIMTPERSGRRVYCRITDAQGNQVQSNTVRLDMKSPLAITGQPVSVTVTQGDTAKVTVAATGTGLSYEWFYANASGGKFYKTSSFIGNTYAVAMTPERSGRRVYCVITDSQGNRVVSDIASLNMASALVITKQPVSVSCEYGQRAQVKVYASGTGLKYEWYFADAGGMTFYKTATFTGNTYTVQMNDARNGRRICCIITDAYGNKVATNTVTLSLAT